MAGGFDLIIRAFFADGGLSAGLAKANAGLTQLGRSGPGARVGLKAVETGARSLAFEAAGLSGPLGRVAAGLLQIAGGNALVLGAVAGIGAIALAYNALTKESREAAEAEKKHREELVRSAQQRAQSALPASQRIGVETSDVRGMLDSLTTARNARAALVTREFHEGNTLGIQEGTLEEVLRADKALTDLDAARADLSLSIAQNRRASASASEDEAKSAERELEARRALRLEAIQLTQGEIASYGFELQQRRRLVFASAAFGAPSVDTNDPLRSGRGATFGRGLILDQFRGQFFGAPTPAVVGGVKPDPKDVSWLKSGAILAQGFSQAITASRAGGVGGAFGAVGALASAGSQVEGIGKGLGKTLGTIGLVGSVLGGVFSLFDNSEERRHKEQMVELKKISEKPTQEARRITLNLVNATTGEIIRQTQYEIGRNEDRDAIDRDGRSL